LWKYLTKWKRIYIEWRLRTRKWQDAEGHDRFSTEIIVDSFIFLDSKAPESEDIEETTIGTFDDEIPF
jgi:single-stranded DNA-binding protein